MSEKIELTEQQIGQVEALAARLTQAQLADYLGFSERTLRNLFERDERALAAYKRGRAFIISEVAGNLIDKAKGGDTASQIFFLKTQAGWRETQEVTVQAVHPFTHLVVTDASNTPDTD